MMYLDYVLLAGGFVLLLISITLALLLLCSKKRAVEYNRVLREETERIDVLATIRQTRTMGSTEMAIQTNTNGYAQKNFNTAKLSSENPDKQVMPPTEYLGDFSSDTGKEPLPRTELIETESADGSGKPTLAISGPDTTVLKGKYEIIHTIPGGGMSWVYLARHVKLGNEWIIKYVDNHQASLVDEADVLKRLNHISLPQIIDVFQNDKGIFLVERYIEGYSLEEALKLGQQIRESQICDWGIQLSQVLSYLHHLETPIIHCDLKPSNIILTHDDRLVLIDFGISRRQGLDDLGTGLTPEYAAPEQFQGRIAKSNDAKIRFGQLPPEQAGWRIDARTDIYSVGVILFELLTGQFLTAENSAEIYNYATHEMANVVRKCIQLDPAERFQTAEDLLAALNKVKNHRTTIAKRLVLRRVAVACCAVAFLGGTGSMASGAYINRMENLSVIDMDPGKAVVTAQQSVQILLQKTKPNGDAVVLDPDRVQWSYSENNIARIDGDRLVGLNVGSTTLYGKYRNKLVSLDITVTEPVEELIDISLRYPEGVLVETYAGNGKREHEDGSLTECSFVSPEYLSNDGETVYCSDSGLIRIMENDEAGSLPLEPDYLTADKVRAHNGAIYAVTGPWQDDEDESWYGILKIEKDTAVFLYYTEAKWSSITDFFFSADETLWYVQQNFVTGATGLYTLDENSGEAVWKMDLPDGTSRMAFDEDDNLYLSVPENGSILRVDKGSKEWRYFAGIEGERHFIDGAIPRFYRPTALAAMEGALYVLDFDTVRKITVEGSGALFTETLAGIPVADSNPKIQLGNGDEAVLAASELASLTTAEGKLLLGDPKNSRIYEVRLPATVG